jgi:iron complex outermembrane receptor protein
MMLASAAQAQTSPSQPPTTEAASTDGTPDEGEIVVTARRREENLLTTPVSATVFANKDLIQQNVRNFQDLRGAVSNLELIPLLSGGTSFTIRGIGQPFNQVNTDAKAGFYVDDVYISRQEGNDLYFYDISNLQILKGPQGTLFGKNTTAGAVILTTQRPTDRLEGYATIRGGSYNRIETEGAINLPLTEGISSRVSFRTQDVDGYIKHLLDDGRSGNVKNRSGRLQLRAEEGPLTVDLLGEYNWSRTDGGATIPVGCRSDGYIQNYNALHAVPYCTAYPVLGKDYLVYGGATLTAPTSAGRTDQAAGGDAGQGIARYVGQGPFNRTTATTLNGRINYELSDEIALHSITAYRRSRARFYTPTNNTPNDIYAEYDDTGTKQFTQELTIGGTALDKRLTFIAGLYYYDQRTTFLQDTGPDWIDPLGYIYDASVKYTSYAVFAQASYKVTPRLELTLGGRYTHDRKSGSSYVFFEGNGATYPTPTGFAQCGYFVGDYLGGVKNCAGSPYTAQDARSWQSFDPKFQISYRWNDQIFTYATIARGYNAGGFNQQLGSQPADGRFPSSYNPEKLWSFEAGVKAELFDQRAIINLSGFYQKYTDIQSGVNILVGNVSTRQVQSAASAHQAGLEGEFTFRPIRDLTLRGNVSYLSQAYDSINPNATSITLDSPVNSAPKYTYSAVISYDIHTGGGGRLTPSVDVRGVGSKPACQRDASFDCKLPAYGLLGFRVDFVPTPDSQWRVGVYGTNVLDKVVQLQRFGYFGGFGIDRYTPGRPAEFGAELSLKF